MLNTEIFRPEWTDRGARRAPIQLPDNAKVCLTVDLGFEGFQKSCQYRLRTGSGDAPDPYSLSFAEYGLRVGIWRLLDVLSEFNILGGVATNGFAAIRYPRTLIAIGDAGHEIIAHGWTNDPGVPSDDLAKEEAEIANTVDAIVRAADTRPIGWMSPGYATSETRRRALVDAGFLYSCDDASDDLPYVIVVDEKPHVIMPRTSFGSNDLSNWFAPRHSPETWLSSFKSQFDAIYHEACQGRPGWMELFLHAHFAGRGLATQEIRRMIRYVLGHDGVWVAQRGQLAKWILNNPAYHG